MNIDPLVQAQIDGRLISVSFLVYIDSPTPVRAWTGIGDLFDDGWSGDSTGGTYKGVGAVLDIPSLQQLVNGVAQRVDFTLSGVDAQIVALADAEAADVRSKDVIVGMQFFADNLQPVGEPLRIWDGEADVIRNDTVSTPDFSRVRTVTLSVGSTTTGRRRPSLHTFTRAQQRSRSSDDAFCDRTGLYSGDSELAWP